MLVPRSYRYAPSPPAMRDTFDEKMPDTMSRRSPAVRTDRRPTAVKTTSSPQPLPSSPPRLCSIRNSSQPVAVPTRSPSSARSPSAASRTMPVPIARAAQSNRRGGSAHDPTALPPAVAALLAVTAIPRPKPNQFRRRPSNGRKISGDELANEWRSDESLNTALSSSSALTMLLENAADDILAGEERSGREMVDECERESIPDPDLRARSTSADSTPSLDVDSSSILSTGSLSSPRSLMSRRSNGCMRRRAPSSLSVETCTFEHPLAARQHNDTDPDDALILSPTHSRRLPASRSSASFKSNLTASLQALKNAAISSLATLSLGAARAPAHRTAPPCPDDLLWSHPMLFPRLSPEFQPAANGTRYPTPPLSFEEQEAPYQQALHAPYLAERDDDADQPSIQMQTYHPRGGATPRKRSNGGGRRPPTDPTSEAGRALIGAGAVGQKGLRLREPRENPDFLRVVVLEMNMRRSGKSDCGRARLWLPPRPPVGPLVDDAASSLRSRTRTVPPRWEGFSASDT